MAHYHIFPVKAIEQPDLLEAEELSYSKYLLAFACARNEGFNLITAQIRLSVSDTWRIIKSNEPSHQGQVTIELGYFSPGTPIYVFWIIRSITKIASISGYIINEGTKEIKKVAPKTPPKKMERGEDWGEEIIDFILF